MKVIDLLNKIANGEEVPKKIRITDVDDRITRHYIFFYDEDEQEYKDDELFPLGARLILDRVLNKKVEVLDLLEEQKKIEKLSYYSLKKIQKSKNKDEWYENRLELLEKRINDYHNKINELIDEVNKLKEK